MSGVPAIFWPAQNPQQIAAFRFPAMRGVRCPLGGTCQHSRTVRDATMDLSMSDNAQKREQPQISIPCDREMLARVKSAAERQHRSVANFARIALAKELERQGQEASA
jgi:hypothetical protein